MARRGMAMKEVNGRGTRGFAVSTHDVKLSLVRVLQTNGSLLDVMVYIHGGGFFSGTGASNTFGPQFLLDKDIVLVTFNYRLGALGKNLLEL
ncbi:hypothetical protein PR048_027620 [Dryococelus australis]|uniref:Carboxylesterase type B domain-containing protein n=1 Tax=Dryococelus australis TaxID=614101 RepID=A0ABQ9GH04_9NEOP|nr:hypothetical protein PR048_027620 [Dryococelus australis]